METLKSVLILLAVIFIFIFIEVFGLIVGINAVKGEKTSFGQVFITQLIIFFLISIIIAVFQFVAPNLSFYGALVGLLIGMFILQARHNTTLLGALGAIFIYAVVVAILYFLLVFVFTGINAQIVDLIGFDMKSLLPFEITF